VRNSGQSANSPHLELRAARGLLNRIVLLVLLSIFCLFGALILVKTPYGQFPDEQSHYRFAKYIQKHGALPPLNADTNKMVTAEAFQPPLYYYCGSLFLKLVPEGKASIYILRCFSLILGATTILFVWKTASLVFPHNTNVILLSTTFVACNPQFIFTHAGITNLVMSITAAAATIYLAVRFILKPYNNLTLHTVLLGLSFGAAVLSRTFTAYLFPICIAAIFLRAGRMKVMPVSTFMKYVSIFAACAALVSGWWYMRNWLYFDDPLLWKFHATTVGAPWVRKGPLTFLYLAKQAAFLHAGFWTYFGLNQYHATIGEYSVYLFLQVLAIFGIAEIMKSRTGDPELNFSVIDKPVYFLLIAIAILGIAEIYVLLLKLDIPQGRYLYITMPAISILFASGLLKIFPVKKRVLGVLLTSLALFLMCVYLLGCYWYPHYFTS